MPEEAPLLIVERPGPGIVLLRLNRPEKRNALATPLLQEIAGALQRADGDDEVRVAVVTGSESVFAAGADLGELAAASSSDPVESDRFKAWAAIRDFRKPLIAAVEGWCLGAGAELMMCADIVVAGEDARIGLPETNLGIMPGAGGTAILPRLVGRALAMRVVLTGEPIGAAQAREAGLIADVVPAGGALEAALDLASTLAARAPLALAAAKASIKNAGQLAVSEHLRAERELFLSLLGTEDKAEGLRAFREKRPPVWRSR
ncbi:2,3-dehydroadipyl-CoA hydratase [Altererythrobacter soli]|uniref:2,3-dehydroadipyl-CoA hydratase n=1 Tax=Croceibacterium soli TaxID=1739690 RepID=A0A6I4USB3_9SPHN|nr:enoyl-CoA hydratase-related protein [Croceibacterium soli]MXP41346.1 2,3-dehydroadipyl-CoA hydratase [Croceibacterium soli]